jgi:hypothetical protein
LDKIEAQLGLIIKSLMSMESRVSRSEDKISKLNMVIFKRLQERRKLKEKIMNLNELEETEFKTTVRRDRVAQTRESQRQ